MGWLQNKSAWEYKRAGRALPGKPKYPFNKMLRLALNAITQFFIFPFAGCNVLWLFLRRPGDPCHSGGHLFCAWPGHPTVYGQATTLIASIIPGGVQLISLGFWANIVGRLYDEAKGRPL